MTSSAKEGCCAYTLAQENKKIIATTNASLMNGSRGILQWKKKGNDAQSSFAPFQLAPQDLEIRLPRRFDELQLFTGPPHAGDVRWLHGQAALSVDRQINRFGVVVKSYFDGARIGDNQRAVAQHVRTDGGDKECSDRRMQDGTAGGEGVGCGARGAGND